MTYDELRQKIQNVRVVVASKYVDFEAVERLSELGFSEFGENQVQALAKKIQSQEQKGLKPLKWHFIGTLQSNKINLLIKQKPILWQSCNSLALAEAVNKRLDYALPTLLEVNTANEASKSGIAYDEALQTYLQIKQTCPNLQLCGVMSIGAHSRDTKEIQKSFEKTYSLYEKLQSEGATICSMGMSSDFELALKCGSNMLRLGSILFKALQIPMNRTF